MIPLALITGFLGSGKTTFLSRLAQRYRGRKVVFLVNEFSAKDVDGSRLARETPDVVSVAGGSIFCQCLVTEFIARLRELPSRFGTPAAPVEAVVVEASGIANPAVAAQMLRESRLDRQYDLTDVVAIVDPGSFGKLLHTLPNIRAQVEGANVIVGRAQWLKDHGVTEDFLKSVDVNETEGVSLIFIARNGKPQARITSLVPAKGRIQYGLLKGKFTIPEDFDAPNPDLRSVAAI